MAKGRKDTESVIASCADYDEDQGEEVQGSRKVANVAAKRSSGALVTAGGAAESVVTTATASDLASDSGYSSHTQATSASADSTASIRAKAEQVAALQELVSVNRQRRPPTDDGETHSQRSGSTASVNKTKKQRRCAEPDCEKCVAARQKQAAEIARKSRQKLTVNTNVSPVKSREISPVKQQPSARQKPAIIQHQSPHPPPQPRRRDSQQTGPRPTSMYEMGHPGMGGPPPPAAYYGNGRPAYPSPHPNHPGALMLVERPSPMVSARGGARAGPRGYSAIPSARRVAPSTVVQVNNSPHPSQNHGEKMNQQLVAAHRMQQAKPRTPPSEDEYTDESEDEEEEEEEEEEEDDYSDEESEGEYDDEDEESDGEDPRAVAAMEARMMKQKQQRGRDPMAALMQQQQAARDHPARDPMAELMKQKLATAHAQQARLEEQKRAMAEQQRRLVEEARRGQMGPPPPPPPLLTIPTAGLPAGLGMPGLPPVPSVPSQSPQIGPTALSMRRPQPQITYPSEHDDFLDSDFRSPHRSMTPGPSGTSANRRPSLASSGATKATSYSHPGQPHVTIESRNGRRMSYIGSERREQLENMHAGFQQGQSPIPQNRNLEQLVAQMVEEQLSMRRGSSNTSEDLHVNFAMDDKLKHAMQYQSKIDHVGHANRRDTLTDLPDIPLTQAALRRNAGIIPSLSGSSRSKRSSDEDPSIISAGHRLTTGSEAGGLTVNGDEMKVRIDTSNGFEMEFDGRIVTLQPIGDGTTAELIIGGKNQARTETTYMSVRGSTATKSIINRQPSQRQRRNTTTLDEIEDDDDRTERRTVYTREERRRDREERQRELETREAREAREAREDRRERRARLEREEVEREREELEREREELKREQERHERRERKERKERKRREEDLQRRDRERKRNSRYEDEDADDYTSDSYTSEDDRRTQRNARRPRAKTYEEKRERRRPASPERERRPRDDGNYNYPPGYGQRAGFTAQPPPF